MLTGGRAARPRLLVAEDNAVNQLVARRLLERLGAEVVVASSGLEAVRLRAVASGGPAGPGASGPHGGPFDLVFMDCAMPDVDGFEATRRIRDWEARTGERRVPIVAMTANVLPGIVQACVEAGMDDYVAKPVSGASLEQALTRWWRSGLGGS